MFKKYAFSGFPIARPKSKDLEKLCFYMGKRCCGPSKKLWPVVDLLIYIYISLSLESNLELQRKYHQELRALHKLRPAYNIS